jgi:hypothetical protein
VAKNSGIGWLKNGNPPGRFSDAPRCGARTKRTGLPCHAPACRGRNRCRLHGGKSTGPKTAAGLARSRAARLEHGAYSAERRAAKARVRTLNAGLKTFLKDRREELSAKSAVLRRVLRRR